MHEPKHPNTLAPYNTNPFSIAFNALSKGFSLNQSLSLVILIVPFVVGIVGSVVNQIPQLFVSSFDKNNQPNVALMVFFSIFIGLSFIVTLLYQSFMRALMAYTGVVTAKGQAIDAEAGLKNTLRRFVSVLIVETLVSLITVGPVLAGTAVVAYSLFLIHSNLAVGIVALIVAIIAFGMSIFVAWRFAAIYALASFEIYDNATLSASQAMQRSKKLTRSRLVEVSGMLFGASIVPIIAPLLYSLGMGAYHSQLKAYLQAGGTLPKTDILSWLPVILFGVVVVPLLLIIIAVIALVVIEGK